MKNEQNIEKHLKKILSCANMIMIFLIKMENKNVHMKPAQVSCK